MALGAGESPSAKAGEGPSDRGDSDVTKNLATLNALSTQRRFSAENRLLQAVK
jgi:hypothetical protein